MDDKFNEEKKVIKNLNQEKQDKLIVEYSSDLIKIQNDYSIFEKNLKKLKLKNDELINDI